MAQSASQGQSSQATQGPAKEERVYVLKDCTMEVVSVGKKDPVKDEHMTIDLVFTFPDNPTPKVVGEFAFNNLYYNGEHVCVYVCHHFFYNPGVSRNPQVRKSASNC